MRRAICSSVLALTMFGGTMLVGMQTAPGQGANDKEAKSEPKAKGYLPMNWKSLGLTDKQIQEVYKIQAKNRDEIDKLEAQIKDLKAKTTKEQFEVLTAEQKKRLEEILKGKAGGTDK